MLGKAKLAVISMAAVAFLAMPETASAGVWLHEGVELAAIANVEMVGSVEFEFTMVPGTKFICGEVFADLEAKPGGGGGINAFERETLSCGGEGLYEGCTLAAHSEPGLPWAVTVNENDVSVKNVRLNYVFDKGCFLEEAQVKIPTMTLTPDNQEAITEFTISGEGVDQSTLLPVKISGTLFPAEAETYGIE